VSSLKHRAPSPATHPLGSQPTRQEEELSPTRLPRLLVHSRAMRCPRTVLLTALLLSWGGVALANPVSVQPGDTLWDLAQRHGTTVEELMQANDLTSADLLPGDLLKLPGSDDVATNAASLDTPATWTVAPGDSLYEIAITTSLTVEELMLWNGLQGTMIHPGDELRLTAPSQANVVRASEAWLEVTIQPGDSLWRIGRAYDVTPAAIAAASGIDVNAVLQPGDRLTIPGVYASNAQASGDVGGYTAPTITVDPGDTLWEIARRYDTTVEALMTANSLQSANLSIGQRLRIVGEGGAPAIAAAVTPSPAIASNTMVWPLRGAITSRFGWRSLTVGGTNMHYGLDIDGNTGDPIVSATAGTVVFSGWSGGYGQVVIVESGGHEYYYAHCSELLVSVGDPVAPGDLIARVGATGRVTGSHLHFEVRVDGNPIDPLPMLEARAGAR